MKVVSWNIGGGKPLKAVDVLEFEDENLAYFAEEIKKLSPDIVCLQESLFQEGRSLAQELADLIPLSYMHEVPTVQKSHIDPNYRLSIAVLSRLPIENKKFYTYPKPQFDLILPNGNIVTDPIHDKMLQVVQIDGIHIANTQLIPLHIFGSTYDEGNGAILADDIDSVMSEHLSEPIIFCGDFNHEHPNNMLPKLFSKISMNDALPNKPTGPTNDMLDHIFYSNSLTLKSADIMKTRSDHYMCHAEFPHN